MSSTASDSQAALRSGLVSVTFRQLSVDRIIDLAREAKLTAIEWGGDVHVPHGDLAAARSARQRCREAGLAISAYGSYYRAGEIAGPAFDAVLETAAVLQAPTIRVWAGQVGSDRADADYRQKVAGDIARICDLAGGRGITVSLEYHAGTLTDSADSAVALLKAVSRPNLLCYWQPRQGEGVEAGVRDIGRLGPWLGNLHVFHWWPDDRHRLALSEGAEHWRHYLCAATAVHAGRPRFASLEFVRQDDPAQFLSDAQTLRRLIAGASAAGFAGSGT